MKNLFQNTTAPTLVGYAFICFIIGTWAYVDFTTDKDALIEQKNTADALFNERLSNVNCNMHVDSLNTANAELSKFKTLTMSMIHRNDATLGLKTVGDIAYMKNDSSRVVVEDVLIGGGKYNYYVKYRVIFADDTVKEVSPEMTY